MVTMPEKASLFTDAPQNVQRALDERTDGELTRLLADVSIAVALRRDVSPHQVLREALDAYGWPEAEWPRVREHVKGWLQTAPLFAWLVERGQPENHVPTVWWRGTPGEYEEEWTTDAWRATRFESKAAAEDFIRGRTPGGARAVEHGFG